MKKVFIGHRGVGKTELLKRHQNYFPRVPHSDLDAEIEKNESQSVSEIFKIFGEKKFRQIEIDTFKKLIQQPNFVISLGAGFECSNIPAGIEIIFVSRRTDSDGRIFLNRPALNPELSPLIEYETRFTYRDPVFRKCADFIYHMPEGLMAVDQTEQFVFQNTIQLKNAFVTLVPGHLTDLNKFSNIELRTDLFSDAEIDKIKNNNSNQFIISYRKPTTDFQFTTGLIDWPLELGAVPSELKKAELVVSNHDDELFVAIEKFESYPNFHQKLCPTVTSWAELSAGHKWQSEKPEQRNFLPRTPVIENKSMWRWYRQLQFLKQKINFIQGHQQFDDQPSLYEYLNTKKQNFFAAVLGDPVHHSKTPVTQNQCIELNVLAVPVRANDFEIAISVLRNLGLVAAAVTSPLKLWAGQLCHQKRNINTIVFDQNKWIGTSTDEYGLEKLILSIPDYINKRIVVWGGGAILNSISQIVPNGVFYSAQTQKPRHHQSCVTEPDVLIWAAPRKSTVQMPPTDWCPEFVVDLNYAENSMGLEYAKKIHTKYISGDLMFYAQAEKQLQFWKEHLKD